MNNSPTILLTGFTGILGKRFAYRLAELGYDVVCPIRAGSEAEARARFESIFHELKELLPNFNESMGSRIHPIPGDVRQKNLGIPSSSLETLKGPKTQGIWHLAARLDLTETNSQDVYNTNLNGTRNVLEFAKQQQIPELHYFSTFGASGKLHEGIIREIPGIKPPSFRNTYERTKWEAERCVWQSQIRGEISATIYRPSIVVGDSVLGRYEQFNVFNHPFDVISQVRIKLCEKQGLDPQADTLKYDLRVLGDRKATLNIVPIDFVLDTVMKIFAVPSSRGRVYHIVNPDPPSLALAEEIFKRNEPWDGVRWELFNPTDGFLNPYEKFIAKQLGFLTPYLLGEAIYDYSNVQTILAFHSGMPSIKNEAFLDAISKRGKRHGWQEVKLENIANHFSAQREQLDSEFTWPEGNGIVVDFSPCHPVEAIPSTPSKNYSVTDRLLGKAYQVRERLVAKLGNKNHQKDGLSRDIVLVPFGLGVTRRGEAETYCYQHNPALTHEVFTRMNQVIGFDIRAFARHEIPGHELLSHMHDNGCWSVTDDLVHLIRLFRDLQQNGNTDLIERLQILPFSAGTYLTAWLAGVVSFEDMALLVHQCMHFMSENESILSFEEVTRWFFNPREKLSEIERKLLKEIRQKVDPSATLSKEALAKKLHGKLELVFSLNANVLEKLISDVRENRIGVSPAIKLSPNTAVFAGNELEMTRFRELFVGKRKIELRRVPIDVKGTPHFNRLREASRHAVELLKLYDQQGRLRDPMIPFTSHSGEWVRTREEFIRTIAGIPNQPCYFDHMIEKALEEGGRHFILVQSGMASTAGDLFDGIIRNNANIRGYSSINVYPPSAHLTDLHPLCKILQKQDQDRVHDASKQSLSETIRWYEKQLTLAHQNHPSKISMPLSKSVMASIGN